MHLGFLIPIWVFWIRHSPPWRSCSRAGSLWHGPGSGRVFPGSSYICGTEGTVSVPYPKALGSAFHLSRLVPTSQISTSQILDLYSEQAPESSGLAVPGHRSCQAGGDQHHVSWCCQFPPAFSSLHHDGSLSPTMKPTFPPTCIEAAPAVRLGTMPWSNYKLFQRKTELLPFPLR